jgi:hypothetical protein
MFSRLLAQTTAHAADLEDALGVATLFLLLFLGLTLSGVA